MVCMAARAHVAIEECTILLHEPGTDFVREGCTH